MMYFFSKKSSIWFLSLVIFATSANAQLLDSLMQADIDVFGLMQIEVVTASRTAKKIDRAPASVTVVTAEMIKDRGYRDIGDVLDDQLGFDFATGQPAGEYPTNLTFRGITDVGQTKVLIMVDGIVRNDISNGWMRHLGTNFTLIDVDRIEIISGPGSALYGANAYAGIVHIITKDLEPTEANPLIVSTGLTLGANSTAAPELLIGYALENGLKIQISGRWYKTAGDGGTERPDPGNYFHNNFEPDSVFTTEHGLIANDRNADGSRKSLPDGFNTEQNNYMIRGRLSKGSASLGFSVWEKREALGSYVVGYEYFANSQNIDYLAHHSGNTLSFSHSTDLSRNVSANTLFYHRQTRIMPETGFVYTYKYQSVDHGDSPVIDKKKSYYNEGNLSRLEQQFNGSLGENHQIVAGYHMEWRNEMQSGISLGALQEIGATNVTSTYDTETPSVVPVFISQNSGVYFQDEVKLGSDITASGGIRYDKDSAYGGILSPKLSLLGRLSTSLRFKLLYGHAYKKPTAFQLYDEWRGSVDLTPEGIRTMELELGYRFTKRVNLQANLFHSWLQDLIEEDVNPDPIAVPIGPNSEKATYFQNQGATQISGVTMIGDLILAENLRLTVNGIYTVGDEFETLNNISGIKGNIVINYDLRDKININLRGQYRGRMKAPITNRYFHPKTAETIQGAGYDYVTDEDADGYMDGYTLFHLTLTGRNLMKGRSKIEPQIIIRNLLDTQYYAMGRQAGSGTRPVDSIQPTVLNPQGFIPPYHPQPGREIYFVLRWDL